MRVRGHALAALAADVLTATSRRRTLWYYLIASTAVAGALVLGAELTVDLRQVDEVAAGRVRLARAPLPGTVRLTASGVTLVDDGQGRLGRGSVDYAAGAVAVPDVAGVVTTTYAVSLVGLSGADRARVLEEGVATRALVLGLELQVDATRRPAVAAPYLFLVFVVQLLVRHLACLVGIVLGLTATFDAVSSALEPGAAELLLSRPISRAEAVLGRFAGALAFGLLQLGWTVAVVLLLGALKLGLWTPMAFAFVPPVLLKFAVLLSIATLVAVATRTAALGLAAACAAWLASTAVYHLQASGVEALALDWLARLVPPVSHLDDVASIAAGIPVDAPGHGVAVTLALAGAWTVAPLLLAVVLVRRRDF